MAGDIGAAIKEARELRDMAASAIAKALGVSTQAIYNWEKNKNLPATDNLLKVADTLRLNREALLQGEMVPLEAPLTERQPPRRKQDVVLAPDAPTFDQLSGPRDVQELGIAVGGESGDFTLNGEVVGYVTRPASLRGRNVFAVRVHGDSMFPRYEVGDILYAERLREPAPGDDGIFEMKPGDEWEAGHAFVKHLVAKGIGGVTVRQYTPAKDFQYDRDQIRRMYRIIPRRELLSI